jgi:CNH domain
VAYSAPWVLAFDARFIEIRDGFTGALVQVLRGSDIRNVSGGSIIASTESQEIMVTQRCQGPTPSFDVQIVYELTRRHVPTMYGAYI